MNFKLIAVIASVCVAAAVVWAYRARAQKAELYDVGSYQELTGRIRAGLAETTTRCELEAASQEELVAAQARDEPRDLGRAPFRALLNEADPQLASETTARLLDQRALRGLGGMSEAEQNLTLIDQLAGEVSNGGFHQYFANSSGDCSARARRAAHEIGGELARVVEAAFNVFPSQPAEDRATRNAQMASLRDEWEAWSAIDDDFYKIPLDQLVARYIRAHAQQLDCPPQTLSPGDAGGLPSK